MKEGRMKLPFTKPCGNGLLRLNNWDGTQLSTTKRGREKKRKEGRKRPRRRESQRKGRKKQEKKKDQPRLYLELLLYKNIPYLR